MINKTENSVEVFLKTIKKNLRDMKMDTNDKKRNKK